MRQIPANNGNTVQEHTARIVPDTDATGALRLSLGRGTTAAEVGAAVAVVPRVLATIRDGSAALAADPLGSRIA